MIVMKFGGTSVADASAMKCVLEIVRQNCGKSLVVVLSACSGITDLLLKTAGFAGDKNEISLNDTIIEIKQRHITLINNLLISEYFREEALGKTEILVDKLKSLAEGVCLLGECTPRMYDSFASFGERLSTAIFETACRESGIDSELIDAADFMITDWNYQAAKIRADLLQLKADYLLKPLLNQGKTIITQGFIGSDGEGHTTTLGRGGSDYSAALIGAAINADEIQIWTDVPGVMSADPRIIPDAAAIPSLTFRAVGRLSYYGAKVLHPDTIKPAIDKNIPVRISDTFRPNLEGTIISNDIGKGSCISHSIVLKQGLFFYSIIIPAAINPGSFTFSLTEAFINSESLIYSSVSGNEIKLLLSNTEIITEFKENFPAVSFFKRKADFAAIISSGAKVREIHDGLIKFLPVIHSFRPYFCEVNGEYSDIITCLEAGKGRECIIELHKIAAVN
ncbi:MAG: aspartate kinase [Bacteroidota bacterium]|nr:aspartate kinase [Bacteroidota bacterium]